MNWVSPDLGVYTLGDYLSRLTCSFVVEHEVFISVNNKQLNFSAPPPLFVFIDEYHRSPEEGSLL